MTSPPDLPTPAHDAYSADHPPAPTVVLIAAVAANGVIGSDGDLAWRHSADLRRVKAMTMGHTLIMGRKNYDAIGRPLPGRRTVVLTRQPEWSADGVTVVHDAGAGLDSALREIVETTGDHVFFVFGGAEIYAQLFDRVSVLELTEIARPLPGDTYFPHFDRAAWREVHRDVHEDFAWVRYERHPRRARGGETGVAHRDVAARETKTAG